MSDRATEDSSRRYQADLVRGSLTNALGFVGKLLQPLLFVVVTWAFGPATTGVFLLVTFIADVFRGAVVDGYADAVTVVASRNLGESGDEDPEVRFRSTTASALRVTTGLSAVAIPIAATVGPLLGRTYFAEHHGFAEAFLWTALGLPFVAIATIALAATKAKFIMHYTVALMNFGRPIGVLVATVVAAGLHTGLRGLMIGVFVVDALVAVGAMLALGRETGMAPMLAAMLRGGAPRGLHSLAVPQAVNLTFNRYLVRLDAIMLAGMGLTSTQVAFYSTGALITSSLREAKLVFSGAMAPVVSRHHGAGEIDSISSLLGRVSRWTATIVAPVTLAVIVFRNDVVHLVDRDYPSDTFFMLVLLAQPYVSCAIGLGGNCIFYTGHSRWNLANSFFIAGLNTVLNLVLIPRMGLLGAAVATATAVVVAALVDLVELRMLERIVIPWREIRTVHVAFLAALVPFAFVGDPAAFSSIVYRIPTFLGTTAIFAGVALALGHPELRERVAKFRAS